MYSKKIKGSSQEVYKRQESNANDDKKDKQKVIMVSPFLFAVTFHVISEQVNANGTNKNKILLDHECGLLLAVPLLSIYDASAIDIVAISLFLL